jgi:hypothetical protein
MSESVESKNSEAGLDLKRSVREVKNQMADRDDVVVELREAQRTRLELLAEELAPVFAQVPSEDDRFDFAISSGAQPRLWIDAVAHVVMGRDRRTFRFVRDTRIGRTVLCESLDLKTVAGHVTRYVAERVVERERVLEGDVEPMARSWAAGGSATEAAEADQKGGPSVARPRRASTILKGLGILLLGVLAGAGLVAALAWERVVAYLGISL